MQLKSQFILKHEYIKPLGDHVTSAN